MNITPQKVIDLAIQALESCQLSTVFNDATSEEFEVWTFDEHLVNEALEALYSLEDMK